MKYPETAIIIRCRNEERWIGETLTRLQNQTYTDFEIVVVDNGSTDQTLNIVNQFDVQLVHLPAADFTFPFAINTGIQASAATDYFVILSAHSVPIGNRWLASAVDHIKKDPQAMGVHGPLKAMPDGTMMDKLIHNTAYWLEKRRLHPETYRVTTEEVAGALGFTNALIRKDLYDQYPINNDFAGGGEDWDWFLHWKAAGYHVIKDLNFAVHHSHYLGIIGWYQQYQHWMQNATPQPFERLSYRRDGAHKKIDNDPLTS